jgi:hypothetical protein
VAAFELGDSFFESFAVGMIGARVVKATFGFAQLLVDVRGSLVDGQNDSASGWIGLLAHVNGVGGESHVISSEQFRRRQNLAGTKVPAAEHAGWAADEKREDSRLSPIIAVQLSRWIREGAAFFPQFIDVTRAERVSQ